MKVTQRDLWMTPREVLLPLETHFSECLFHDPFPIGWNAMHHPDGFRSHWFIAPKGWTGLLVLMNPPYSRGHLPLFADRWCEHAEELSGSYYDNTHMIGILPCDPGNRWASDCLDYSAALCLPDHRIRFIPPEGVKESSPRQATMIIYCGFDPKRFARAMRRLYSPSHDNFGLGQCLLATDNEWARISREARGARRISKRDRAPKSDPTINPNQLSLLGDPTVPPWPRPDIA